MNRRIAGIAVLSLLCHAAGCQRPSSHDRIVGSDSTRVVPTPLAEESDSPSADNVAAVAASVSRGVGMVTATSAEGDGRPVYVFEESHNSRIGQIEIAVMLLRLRQRFGIRSVGLEGAYQSSDPLDAAWFHPLGGAAGAGTREDVAVRMLAEGEISSAEALALVFADEYVYGTEDRELYDRDSIGGTGAEFRYLLLIAESLRSPEEVEHARQLLQERRVREAEDVLMPASTWIRAQYDSLSADTAVAAPVLSCETLEWRLQMYRDTAAIRDVPIDETTQQEGDAAMDSYRLCRERSEAMVKRVVEQVRRGGVPTAMVIGAAHTEGVTRLLRDAGVPHAVIRPAALHSSVGEMTEEEYERKLHGHWARSSPGTLGAVLNAGVATDGHKPPPVIEKATAHGSASLLYAGNVIATAARGGRRVPTGIDDPLLNLPDCTIDPASFETSGYDVVFKATLKQTDGSEVVVWSRVGTEAVEAGGRQLTGFEPKLLQARSDLLGRDGGGMPPRKPPAGTVAASGEGPGDGRRGKLVIARTGPQTLAVFASTRKAVIDAGRLST